MALLVFLTFLTLFTNSYIPVWMVDNERTHMNTVMVQFGNLKSDVDGLIVNAEVTGRTDLNMFAPITLGANGIPIFASATAGQLIYAPYITGMSALNVSFQYKLGNNLRWVFDNGGGMVQLYAPNRYYVQQWVAFENGAIIVKQLDGQTVRAFPSLDITKTASNSQLNVSWTSVDFIGVNSTIAGTSTAGLNIDLIYFDSQVYDNGTNPSIPALRKDMNVTLAFKTQYGQAWYIYLNNYLKTPLNNLVNNTDYVLSHNADYSLVTLKLMKISYFTQNKAIVQISVQMS